MRRVVQRVDTAAWMARDRRDRPLIAPALRIRLFDRLRILAHPPIAFPSDPRL
jgi:hypothetical protein